MKIQHHTLESHNIKSVMMVYGFKTNTANYDFVLTLVTRINTTYVYGFLTTKQFSLAEFKQLWIYLKSIIKTDYLKFQVLLKHFPAYKLFLPIERVTKSKTFNDYDCELLTVNMNKEWKKNTQYQSK